MGGGGGYKLNILSWKKMDLVEGKEWGKDWDGGGGGGID